MDLAPYSTSPSSRSTGSMVEITAPTVRSESVKILFSKSHVYVHPSSYARDNRSGFACLVEQTGPSNTLLSWIPDSMAQARPDYGAFLQAERASTVASSSSSLTPSTDEEYVLVEPIPERGEGFAFSVPLSQVYSIIAYPPSLSKWYGSLTINLVGGQTLPTLHFHDDESPSTISLLAAPRTSNGSTSSPPRPTWGGEDLLGRLRQRAHLLRSMLEPNLYLVDPNRADTELHSTPAFDDSAVDDVLSPIPPSRRPVPGPSTPSNPSSGPQASFVHSPRTTILSTFSTITKAASSLLSHPSIAPHLPQPVRSLVHADAPQFARWSALNGTEGYESARVYLARWARLVAEEGERAKRAEISGVEGERKEGGDLGVWEVLRVTNGLGEERTEREGGRPIGRREWEDWWDDAGKPTVDEKYFRREVYRRGVDPSLRSVVWPFLLGVYPWSSTALERESIWSRKAALYASLRSDQTLSADVRARPEVAEEIHRIDVDCRRTDRSQALFSVPLVANASGEMIPQEEDDGRTASNQHVDRLADVLLTYGFWERELGYVQGMSDLCAPLYVVLEGDDPLVFWCFVEWMEIMPNFLRDQSGMKGQLSTLQQLIAVMDPELYLHLEKTESLNLFFCFRWILIAFKREFPFNDTLSLWEVLFTRYRGKGFCLFLALAVLRSHRDVLLRYLTEFDEMLKYCNDLSGTLELESTIAQADVLYLSFRSLVEDVDRRQAERDAAAAASSADGVRRRPTRSHDRERSEADGLEIPNLPVIGDALRELLVLE